jgi:hypothetical protein
MSVKVANNRFMVFSLAGFYQQILNGALSLQELGNRVVKQAEAAFYLRQIDILKELGSLLSNLPIKEYQLIGQYYLGWCEYYEGSSEPKIFENVLENSAIYRPKALMSLAAIEARKGDYASEAYYFTEAKKHADSITTLIKASKGLAVAKAKEGFPASALIDLESIVPLVRHAEPFVYFDFLNSYAVELGRAGRKSEARNISRMVLASPFAPAYPEWRETAQELKEPSHSFVAVPSIEPASVEVETIEAHTASKPEQEQPATVLAFPALKEAPKPQKPKQLTPQEVAELTPGDMRELLLAAIKTGAIEQSEYIKMMSMAGLLKGGPAEKILDLESEEVLNDIAVIWPVQIGAEEFVGFLSALRDCDDSFRLKDILDRLIGKVYHETQESSLNEEEWRLRVERKLPEK